MDVVAAKSFSDIWIFDSLGSISSFFKALSAGWCGEWCYLSGT
jgi:hypothetical protein